jgi:hypothetical protein
MQIGHILIKDHIQIFFSAEEKIGWTDRRLTPNDGKRSHRLWPVELKN